MNLAKLATPSPIWIYRIPARLTNAMESSFLPKPAWLKTQAPSGENYKRLKVLSRELGLHTVCEEARCPNIGECWGGGTATFMLLGDLCTRGCRFCAVNSGNPQKVVDVFEPEKIAVALEKMGLSYVVLTSVDRDDLADGGASHIARTIVEVRRHNPEILVEVLTPDFAGNIEAVRIVAEARPDVFAHNVETIRRLQKTVRDIRAGYEQSLEVLRTVKKLVPESYTKSSIMLGLGETKQEVMETMSDLRSAGVGILTIGQYLRPSSWHLSVQEYISPRDFEEYRLLGESMGFLYVASGPLVRTSYRAGEYFLENMLRREKICHP